MSRLIFPRLGEAVIAVWGVVTIVFVVSRLLGDPTVLLLPVGATAAQMQDLRVTLGLDQPIALQYVRFLSRAVQGDFGESYQFMRPALGVVLDRLPATLLLAAAALAAGVGIGMLAASAAAIWRGTVAEAVVMIAALLGQATPVFWSGIMLILLFAVRFAWFPTGGFDTAGSLVLPAATLALFTIASIARLLRASLLDALREDHVRTARAKGVAPTLVFARHVLRNALIPMVTMVGILAGELLGGSVVTETVFSWPGVGRVIVQAIEAKDFPVVQAGVTVVAVIFVTVNVSVDFLYGLLDPRIREPA
jgi:peptide/nickel transport system permease protein